MRYGNVFGSRGSVLPYFHSLITNKSKFIPVTDKKMTRFWITLDEGVDFVVNSFFRMQGGEIFVPKLPSIRIIDLAKAMAPDIPIKITSIRPGEKIHETMCPKDDAHLTIEFKDHFVITPSIIFFERKNDFFTNNLKEKGQMVKSDFSYSSGNNINFLQKEEIRKYTNNIILDLNEK